MLGKAVGPITKPPQRKNRENGGKLSRKGEKIKFVYVRFKRWQIVWFRESSGWQWVPQLRRSWNERWFVN